MRGKFVYDERPAVIINEYCKTISVYKLCVNIDSSQQYIHGDLGHFKNVSNTLYLLVTTIFTYYLIFCLKDIYIHDLLIYIHISRNYCKEKHTSKRAR